MQVNDIAKLFSWTPCRARMAAHISSMFVKLAAHVGVVLDRWIQDTRNMWWEDCVAHGG